MGILDFMKKSPDPQSTTQDPQAPTMGAPADAPVATYETTVSYQTTQGAPAPMGVGMSPNPAPQVIMAGQTTTSYPSMQSQQPPVDSFSVQAQQSSMPAASPAMPAAPVNSFAVSSTNASDGSTGSFGASQSTTTAPVVTAPTPSPFEQPLQIPPPPASASAASNAPTQSASVAVEKDAGTGSVSVSASSSTAPTAEDKHEELDLMTHLTQRSNRVFMLAQGKAKEYKNQFIDSEHLLFGLLADSEIYKILTDLKIQPKTVEEELAKVYKKEESVQPPQFSPRVKRIIDLSLVVARQLGYEFISPEHILVSLVDEGEGVGAQILKKMGLKKDDLNKKITGKKAAPGEQAESKQKNALAEFTVNLTEKAQKGLLDPVVERSDVIERVIHILSRRSKNNPCLTGEAGVGKTAVAEGLAQRIVAHQVPESLLNKQILQLDLMSVLAGASHRGEFEQRMKNLVEEVQGAKGQIILFIDEIHNIVGAGSSGEGSMDASNFLKPALSRGEIQLIGATTLTEYRKYIEKDPALERRFQPVLVPEPSEEAAVKMLMAIKGKYEAFHRVKISDPVIEEAVKLSKRYVGDRFLPDKAVDLIDEAASAVRLPLISLPEEIQSLETRLKQVQQERAEAKAAHDTVKEHILNNKIDDMQVELDTKKEEYNMKKGQTTTEVTPDIIRDIVSRWTGVPISKISESEVEKLSKLEDIIHKRMIDQEEAVGVVAQAVRRGRAGLKSTDRPIGSFVFLGPTGVGKTELAKSLAEILFGQEEAMIRLDMTEYMEKHEVAKLLGAPPGYVGYEEGGKLTEAVRRRPYSVVLFDEIEKAHPDIFNIMLQILDDGRLTDNKGHTISFKNTVVICTSNIGSKLIQQELINNKKAATDKTAFNSLKEKVMAELMKFFRPELVNRFDEVTVFKPLSFEDVMKIVKLQMKALKKLLEDQQMSLIYTDSALEEISRLGYDPVFGARPLRRTIQKEIENPISTLIIKGDMKPGDIVRIDFADDSFIFDVGRGSLFEDEQNKKWYMCETTSKSFKTVVKDVATVVSPYCGSVKVRALTEEETKVEEAKQSKAADDRRIADDEKELAAQSNQAPSADQVKDQKADEKDKNDPEQTAKADGANVAPEQKVEGVGGVAKPDVKDTPGEVVGAIDPTTGASSAQKSVEGMFNPGQTDPINAQAAQPPIVGSSTNMGGVAMESPATQATTAATTPSSATTGVSV